MKLFVQQNPEYQDINILTQNTNEKNVSEDNARDYGSLVLYLKFCRWIFPICVFTGLINNERLD